eukprot:2730202-Rhodomonas_salina.3
MPTGVDEAKYSRSSTGLRVDSRSLASYAASAQVLLLLPALPMLLRACYAMSGTVREYLLRAFCATASGILSTGQAYVLRACCAMSGTDVAYARTQIKPSSKYSSSSLSRRRKKKKKWDFHCCSTLVMISASHEVLSCAIRAAIALSDAVLFCPIRAAKSIANKHPISAQFVPGMRFRVFDFGFACLISVSR